MTWYADYHIRKERLMVDGLLVLVRGARIDPGTGFIGVYFDANEGDLLRGNVDRGFELHLSLGFASDYHAGIAEDAVERINQRWRGRLVHLRVGWVGSGGSAQLAHDDVLANDPDVWWLHKKGHYGNGLLVRARDLHVSL